MNFLGQPLDQGLSTIPDPMRVAIHDIEPLGLLQHEDVTILADTALIAELQVTAFSSRKLQNKSVTTIEMMAIEIEHMPGVMSVEGLEIRPSSDALILLPPVIGFGSR